MNESNEEERNKISYRRFLAGVLAGVTVLSAYVFATSHIKRNIGFDKTEAMFTISEEQTSEESATAIIMENYTAMIVDLDTSRHTYSPLNGIKTLDKDLHISELGYVFPGDGSTVILFAKNGDEIVANTEYTKIITGSDSHEKALFFVETQLGETLVTEYNTGKKLELTQNYN